MRKHHGFTVLELSISAAIFSVLLGAATGAMITDKSTQRVLLAEMGPETRARSAIRKLSAELRMAGLNAEDLNGNGELDAGEDINDNGELDADWNLDDDAVNQDNLIFNRRVEIRYSDEDVAPSTVYSRKVTYRVVNNRLIRQAVSTDFATNTTKTRNYVMAEDISAIRFSRKGRVITVEIDVMFPEDIFRTNKRTMTEKILLRN